MASGDLTLLSNGTATGAWLEWRGGQGLFTAEATWNGATIKLQFKTSNGTILDAGTDTTLTANGGGRFFLPLTEIRVNVSGSPTGVYSYAQKFGV
jgi:hypothetical protein